MNFWLLSIKNLLFDRSIYRPMCTYMGYTLSWEQHQLANENALQPKVLKQKWLQGSQVRAVHHCRKASQCPCRSGKFLNFSRKNTDFWDLFQDASLLSLKITAETNWWLNDRAVDWHFICRGGRARWQRCAWLSILFMNMEWILGNNSNSYTYFRCCFSTLSCCRVSDSVDFPLCSSDKVWLTYCARRLIPVQTIQKEFFLHLWI